MLEEIFRREWTDILEPEVIQNYEKLLLRIDWVYVKLGNNLRSRIVEDYMI